MVQWYMSLIIRGGFIVVSFFDVQIIDVIHRQGGLYWDLEVLSAALGGPQNTDSYFPIQSDLGMSTILTFFHSLETTQIA